MSIAKRLTETCWEMYRRMPTGLSPEICYFNTVPGANAEEDIFVKVHCSSNSCSSSNSSSSNKSSTDECQQDLVLRCVTLIPFEDCS